MTKDEVINVVKRYPLLYKPFKDGLDTAVFYVGNRKFTIEITYEIKIIFEILDIVLEKEKDYNIKQMIKEILSGQSDIFIMQKVHYSKNAYYARKGQFLHKVYNCCISRGLVSFEEILVEEIA